MTRTPEKSRIKRITILNEKGTNKHKKRSPKQYVVEEVRGADREKKSK